MAGGVGAALFVHGVGWGGGRGGGGSGGCLRAGLFEHGGGGWGGAFCARCGVGREDRGVLVGAKDPAPVELALSRAGSRGGVRLWPSYGLACSMSMRTRLLGSRWWCRGRGGRGGVGAGSGAGG